LEYSIIARAKRHSREREQIPDGRWETEPSTWGQQQVLAVSC
jgi:hypothetical protein